MEPTNIDIHYLYEHSPVGHIIFNQDGRIVLVNQTLREWLEADDNKWQATKSFPQLLSKAGQLYYHMVLQQLMTLQKGVQEISLDIVTLTGKRFPCLFNAKIINQEEGNDNLMYHGAIIKTDDRKKYESELVKEKERADELKKKLQFITNNIPVLSFTLSPEGEVEYLNDRFYKYLQANENNYTAGTIFNNVHRDDITEVEVLWNKALASKTKFEKELRIKNPMNEYEWFLGRIVPYKNEEREAVMWFGTFVNIHEHKTKQEQAMQQLHYNLLDANETINKNEKSFKQIAFEQSHVVRRPLANILGLIHLLTYLPVEEEVKEVINMLELSAEQLDDVIKSITSKTHEIHERDVNAFVI